MIALLLCIGCGAAVMAALSLLIDDRTRWRASLQTYQLLLPHDLTPDDASRWLASIAAMTHPPRWSLFPLPPVIIEVIAARRGIVHYLLIDAAAQDKLLAGLRATLPGARLEAAPDAVRTPPHSTIATEYTLSSRTRPLAADRAEAMSATLLASLQPLCRDERVCIQVIITSAGTPRPVVANSGSAVALQEKQANPLLVATLRIGVAAASRQRASFLLARAESMLHGVNVPGVQLMRRRLPVSLTARRLATRSYPFIEWPLLLNAREATSFLLFPFRTHLPGMPSGQARQLPPPPQLPTRGAIIGASNYPGLTQRLLALTARDRLHHLHLIGPTGTGKSTLLAQLALQDIAAGHGVIVVDLKGDLVTDIAARIPDQRAADVVWLDPSAVPDATQDAAQEAVIGFNPLFITDGKDLRREIVAERVLSVFRSLYAEFWGPRTDEVLRATLFSLVFTTAPDGSAFTLMEAPELLTSPALRRYVTAQPTLPAAVRSFWQWFDGSLRTQDRLEATGPVLNKLRAFSLRTSMRLMLGQSEGIQLEQQLQRQRILLVSLPKGTLGSEAAQLLGALFVAALWEAVLDRISLPPLQRRPVFVYLDEFQDVARIGAETNLADMLAQARGLGVSLTLAHQYLSQLPQAVRDAALGTVRTHIAFQLEWDDAQSLAARFAPLSCGDLTLLNPFEFVMKPSVAGQILPPVTGSTRPLAQSVQDVGALAWVSRARYGLARSDIEARLQTRLRLTSAPWSGRYGREKTTKKKRSTGEHS